MSYQNQYEIRFQIFIGLMITLGHCTGVCGKRDEREGPRAKKWHWGHGQRCGVT